MSDIRNPLAKLTPVPEQSSDQLMVSMLNTKASPTIARNVASEDLNMITRDMPGPMPWETSAREPVAKFKEQDVP